MTDQAPAVHHLDQEYDTSERFTAKLVSSDRITPYEADEIREIVLDVDRPGFDYEVGQSIGIFAPGDPELGGKEHFRLYSVADLPERSDKGLPRIKICVRRCKYIDEYSGEEYRGVASNYLCDLRAGDRITLSGPYGLPFEVPEDHSSNLILICTSTGIAPFRAFVKHIYRDIPDWSGAVWLFYGATNPLEMVYMNDEHDDFVNYYDRDTFAAFKALSPRPHWSDPIAWDGAIGDRADELLRYFQNPKTHVYVAGLESMREQLDKVFSARMGSEVKWQRRKAEMMAGERWVELLY
ncbi:MAG: ferredoxin-NADP reductase [Acidobacteria bacterium]|nr:ferredoxin-NADP reductase [Acidobacteriota bacterium]